MSTAWRQHMRRGEFEAAWAVGDRELGQPREADAFTRPRHLQRIWDGRPIDGRRVLVRLARSASDGNRSRDLAGSVATDRGPRATGRGVPRRRPDRVGRRRGGLARSHGVR